MKTTVYAVAAALFALVSLPAIAETKPEVDSPSAPSYAQTVRSAKVDIDYKVDYKPGIRSFLVAALHGGNIEPGTTELAQAIAAGNYGFYAFNGLKRDSSALFVPSTKFDEPDFIRMAKNYGAIISIHIISSNERIVYVGGNNRSVCDAITRGLATKGYTVKPTPKIGDAWANKNVINRNSPGGAQVEISSTLVDDMFRGPVSSDHIRMDASRRTADFDRFVSAFAPVLGRSDNQPTGVKITDEKNKDKNKNTNKGNRRF